MEANKVIVDKKLARGVLIQDEKILLAKDIRTSQGHFFLPGGHVEPGESVVKTLEREWIEELGCHIHVGAFIGCVEHMWNYKKESDGELVEVFEINDTPILSIKDVLAATKKPILKNGKYFHIIRCKGAPGLVYLHAGNLEQTHQERADKYQINKFTNIETSTK